MPSGLAAAGPRAWGRGGRAVFRNSLRFCGILTATPHLRHSLRPVKTNSAAPPPTIDKRVFLPTFFLVVLIGAALVVDPRQAETLLKTLLKATTGYFGWLYLLFGGAGLIALAWLALGRYGRVKLGDADDEPEFSTPSWVAMMFTAGIGIGLCYWAFIEPIFYYRSPPFGAAPGSSEAAEWAHMYGQFHWGMVPWIIYALPALPIAYSLYVRKQPFCRVSAASRGVLGRLSDGWVGAGVDIVVVIGIIGAAGTTLGFGLPLVSALISECFSLPDTLMLRLGILIMWTAVFSVSVYLGLEKGIRRLANLNAVLGVGFLLFVLMAGPTVFTLSLSTNSLGLLLDNLFRMSFWMDPIDKGGFPEDWTVFYWGWWIGYAPMVGLFVARISKGRTIRQVVLGEVIWGSLGCCAFFAVFGGYSLHAELNGIIGLVEIIGAEGNNVPAAIVALVNNLPGGVLTLLVFTALSVIFLATTLDSAAYVLASVSTRNLPGDGEPARWNRFAWAFALATVSMGLLSVGGLKAVQTSTVITALPLIPVLVIMQLSLFIWLRQDFGKAMRPACYVLEQRPDGTTGIREV